MAIQMVGGEVEPHGNPRMERRRCLELETARLDDVDCVWCRLIDLGAQGRTDISANQRLPAHRLQHPPDERRRRRLAFGSGDRDQLTLYESPGKLELTDRLDPF